jgi:hypothetical protein
MGQNLKTAKAGVVRNSPEHVTSNNPIMLCRTANKKKYTGWAKSRYRVIIFFFTGIVHDGIEFKYRTKKVDFEGVLEYIPTFGPLCI